MGEEARGKIPLYVVRGVTGVGKSTMLPQLRALLPGWCVFDADCVLNGDIGRRTALEVLRNYSHHIWLRIADGLHACGQRVLICGVLHDWEFVKYTGYGDFDIHWVMLDCDAAEHLRRLSARGIPEGSPICRDTLEWAERFRSEARQDGYPIIDTTGLAAAETARRVAEWATASGGDVSGRPAV